MAPLSLSNTHFSKKKKSKDTSRFKGNMVNSVTKPATTEFLGFKEYASYSDLTRSCSQARTSPAGNVKKVV